MFDWDKAFTNSNMNDMVGICPKTIQIILRNFIFHQTVYDDKDPSWLNTNINLYFKRKIKFPKISAKIVIMHSCKKKLEHLQKRLNNSINSSEHNYYTRMANKLNSIQKSSKAPWSLLKSFQTNEKSLTFQQFYTIMPL